LPVDQEVVIPRAAYQCAVHGYWRQQSGWWGHIRRSCGIGAHTRRCLHLRRTQRYTAAVLCSCWCWLSAGSDCRLRHASRFHSSHSCHSHCKSYGFCILL